MRQWDTNARCAVRPRSRCHGTDNIPYAGEDLPATSTWIGVGRIALAPERIDINALASAPGLAGAPAGQIEAAVAASRAGSAADSPPAAMPMMRLCFLGHSSK
jgi:hypothetical protein